MAVDTLAVRVCRAIRTVRREDEAWVALDRLVGQPGLERRTEVDAAAAFAAAKGWLGIRRRGGEFRLAAGPRAVIAAGQVFSCDAATNCRVPPGWKEAGGVPTSVFNVDP